MGLTCALPTSIAFPGPAAEPVQIKSPFPKNHLKAGQRILHVPLVPGHGEGVSLEQAPCKGFCGPKRLGHKGGKTLLSFIE